MASQQETVDFILDHIMETNLVSAKKMFGEYALYCNGKVVALICDDQLFVKITSAGKSYVKEYKEGYPYKGAKSCFLIEGDKWKSSEWFTMLIKITAENLPAYVKKPAKIRKNT